MNNCELSAFFRDNIFHSNSRHHIRAGHLCELNHHSCHTCNGVRELYIHKKLTFCLKPVLSHDKTNGMRTGNEKLRKNLQMQTG